MTSTLTHKGYVAQLSVDAEAGIIHGQVVNTRDVLTFSAKSAGDLKAAFVDTIEDYEEWCSSLGELPQKPLSGTITLRMGPELHQAAANRAAMVGTSLNAWIVATLERDLGRRAATLTAAELEHRIKSGARDAVVSVLSQRTVVGSDQNQDAWDEVPQEVRSYQ